MDFKKSSEPSTNDPHNSKAEQLKKKANDEYGKGNYDAAIKTYNKILKLPSIPSDFQATIFSNRSAAFLCKNNKSMAIKDAKLAIKLRPSWWRPYYRLGSAYEADNKLEKAIEQFEAALALTTNPEEEKSIKEKLYKVRHQFGIESRQECLQPHPELWSEEEQLQKLHKMFTPEEVKNAMEMAKSNPYILNVFKGHQYRYGMGGIKEDFAQAAKHYAEAARLGNPEGMYNLAKLYDNGQGVKQDYETSIFWLRKAAEMKNLPASNVNGVAHAQHSLGLKYTEGIGVKKDLKEAARWYQMAVQNNFGPSANNLGMFYKNGWGVERSLEKAFFHFQMAADWESTPGMMNLADCYLLGQGTGKLEGDREKALHWLRRAASLGDLLAQQRIQEMEQFDNAPIASDEDLLLQFESMVMEPQMPVGMGFKDSLTEEHQQFIPAVKAAAEQGSIAAEEVLTIWGCMTAAMNAFKRGDNAQMIAQMAKAIRLDYQLVQMPKMFKPVVQKCIKAQPNNIDTIVCHVHMNTKNMEVPKIIDKYLQKFPDDPYLLEMRGACFLMPFNQTKEAINLLEAALKKHPNNIRLLYALASSYSGDEDSFDNTKKLIKVWDDFLRVAPRDHPKVPAAYYRKAMAYVQTPAKSIQCFEQGLAAEKFQLPCFLPYNFEPKYQFEKIYDLLKLIENEKNNENKAGCSTSTGKAIPSSINSDRREHVISNPRRKMLLNKQREIFKMDSEMKEKHPYAFTVSKIAPKKPKPASMIGLMEITLDQMEPDNIYNRSILELKIVDWPLVLSAVMMIVEDKNGHVERLAIYDWPGSDNLALMLQTFRPQRTLRIINPYLRIAMDQDRAIRVEDPSYVILGELPPIEKRCCSCCGVNGDDVVKILKCAKCKMAFYCSKECQQMDWIEFGHKLVCKHLAKFSDVVFGQ